MRRLVWSVAVLAAGVGFGCEEGSVAPVRLEPVGGPEWVDFGLLRPGEEARQAVALVNPNPVALEASLVVEGSGRASFSAPSRLRLVPGANELELIYRPAQVDGDDEAALRVDFPADPGVLGPTVLLVGRAAPSALSLEPLRLDLGRVVVGSTLSAAFRVADRTGRDLDISLRVEPSTEDFAAPEPAVVAGRGDFQVGFVARRRAAPRRAAQVVAHAEGGGRSRAEVFAEVVEAPLRCRSPLDLGYVSPGGVAEGAVTCENESDQTLVLGPVGVADPAGQTVLPGGERFRATASAGEVPPRGSVELRVGFEARPADEDGQGFGAELHLSASVSGQDGLPTRPGRVAVEARVGTPVLAVAPQALDFGRLMLGTSSRLPVVLENRGRWPVRFDQTRVVGSGGFTLPPLTELPPGGRVEVEIEFAPLSAGVQRATAELAGAGYGPVNVSLSGEGFEGPPCTDLFAWPELPFGSVYADYTRTLALRLENRGEAACVVGPFAAEIPQNAPIEVMEPGQVLLSPGERRDVEFRYRPTEESRLDVALSLYVNASPDVLPLRLTGAGVTWRVTPAVHPPGDPGDGFRWPAIALPAELRFHRGPGCAAQEGFVDVIEQWAPPWEHPLPLAGFEVGEASLEGPDGSAFVLLRREPARPFPTGVIFDRNERSRFTGARWVVAYRPAGPGQHRAWLRVPADGITEPLTVPLFGDAGPTVVEDVIEPDPPLDVLVTVYSRDPTGAPAPNASHLGSTVLLGRRSDLADGLGALWDAGLDMQVSSVLYGMRAEDTQCPFFGPSYRHRTTSDFRQPPPGTPDGACSFFARGSDARGPGVDWRRIALGTQPSPTEALREILQAFPSSGRQIGGGFGVDVASQALGHPLSRGWNGGFLRPGAALAILSILPGPAENMTYVAPFEGFVARRGGKRSSVMISVVSGDHTSTQDSPTSPLRTCDDLGPDGFETVILSRNHRLANGGPTGNGDNFFFENFVMPSGGRAVLGTCTANWAEWIATHGLPVNGFRTRYPLEELAEGSTVEVTVGGRAVPEQAADGTPNWWYVPEFNRVDFSESAAPRRGEQVRFRYQQRCSEPDSGSG